MNTPAWQAYHARSAERLCFDNGCDLPDVTLKVDFVSCENTVEYAQYAHLQNIYLGDSVQVVAPRIGVAVAMRMTQYTYISVLPATERSDGTAVPIRKKVSSTATERRYRKRF